MSSFSKNVAKELDRRQRRRKMTWWAVWAALIAAAVMYLRCGNGWGTGDGEGSAGKGSGSSKITSTNAGSGEKRCAIRVASDGTTMAGKPATAKQIIEKCKAVDVVVTGDAREGEWKQVCGALDAAHVAIVMHSDAKVCPP